MSLEKIRKRIIVIALIILSFGIGYWFGKIEVKISWQEFNPKVQVLNKEAPVLKNVDFSLFWDVWKRLERNYIDKKKLDSQKMVWGAIKGMVESLNDPYTVFLAPKENEQAKEDLNGTFEGIGAQLGVKDKKIIVVAPLKGMPAEKAGLKAADWIIKVDNKETISWSVFEAVRKIRGPKGTKVVLTVLHEGEKNPTDVEIIRGTIKVPSVELEFKDAKCKTSKKCGKIALLKLYRFGDNTNEEWDSSVVKIQTSKFKVKGLILDLRNNPGGYLQGSVYIASEFLNNGVIVIQEYSNGQKQEFKVNRNGNLTKIPMVVLINKGSASASEIVAGALKVRGRAKLVGDTSFGKGSIQEVQDLIKGAGLHITTAHWLLPDSTWINGKGLKPDYKVFDNPKTEKIDEQLQKAIEILITN